MVFDDRYAAAYDALYRDKDYEGECDYLEALFLKHGCKPESILDLGCGTGGHALVLSHRGYEVVGVDRSPAMLAIAREKSTAKGLGLELVQGDIAGFQPNRKFDAVISMFSVMGYLADEATLAAAFRTARESMDEGGLFLFDCWNGDAVLADPPVVREKEVPLPHGGRAFRVSTPELDPASRTVWIEIRMRWEVGGAVEEKSEHHPVRYFFPGELRKVLASAGFPSVDIRPFLSTSGEPTAKHWNMMVVCVAGSNAGDVTSRQAARFRP